MTQHTLAFVLGGGGARGALQVGALRALQETGVRPDLWVGASAGAVNAAYLAVHGFTAEGLAGLEAAWREAAEADLLPANYLWLTIRSLFNRAGPGVEGRIRDFMVAHGLAPDLRFGQLTGLRLILVAADLESGGLALYGTDPDQSVLEGLLASTAIPPWVRPLKQEDRLLIDGGVLSNLPIEPALTQGATEIVALDVSEPYLPGPAAYGFGPFLVQLMNAVEQRQIYLEKQLAAGQGARVHHIRLRPPTPMAVWEFPRAPALFEPGYRLMRRYLDEHPDLGRPPTPRRSSWRRLWPWRR